MFERFTADARDVVVGARAEAASLGHAPIGTEHLLLALLDPRSGSASRLLAGVGVDKARVYAEIDRLVGRCPVIFDSGDAAALRSIGIDLDVVLARVEAAYGPVGRPTSSHRRWFGRRNKPCIQLGRPFSGRSKKVLVLSLREALRLEHKWIGSEHILLGLIREGEGLAALILANAGVDLAELRRRTESDLAQAA